MMNSGGWFKSCGAEKQKPRSDGGVYGLVKTKNQSIASPRTRAFTANDFVNLVAGFFVRCDWFIS